MVRPLPDGGRGHPDRGDAGRHRVELGDLPRIPRQCRAPAEGAQLRHVYRPFGAAHVCDGPARPRRERRPRTICARWRTPSREAVRAGALGLLDLARDDAYHARTAPRSPAALPIGRRSTGWSARWPSSIPASSRSAPTSPAARRSASFSTGCARWRSTAAGRSCSARWRPSRASTRTRGITRLRWIDETVAQGGRIWGQATTRSINAIFSLKSYLPFDYLPGWQELRALPLDEQKARLRDPEVRAPSRSPRKPR